MLKPHHKEKLKKHAEEIGEQVERAFTEHPNETGETYVQHLWFTTRMTLRLLYVSTVLMLHGLFPFLFTHTASAQLEIIYGIMKSRIPKARLAEMQQAESPTTEMH